MRNSRTLNLPPKMQVLSKAGAAGGVGVAYSAVGTTNLSALEATVVSTLDQDATISFDGGVTDSLVIAKGSTTPQTIVVKFAEADTILGNLVVISAKSAIATASGFLYVSLLGQRKVP